ncbi:MAG: carotenoid oxygenase family protein [Alphaproteobacteria bacterium]|nr:carotenoid oxygenase family protein [Alphaproteobacteria bacterium]MBU1515933.1 carotenoid oxygenase family protein [Alphaproteobacteria bacterium]MBU2094155.1 carotenoid oxygenase family protein [Alphaproteobacteria bacterium]MBU2151507.1 carotenoid oxygenase family protein [Alphaproteobacteria bacterium]MBU2305217.1 carotenoid oxygenase family protein [Alphaproteobacteria bacterium]
MDRRHFLSALGGAAATAILTPEIAQAAAQMGQGGVDWQVAFADLETDVPRTGMKLVQGRAPQGLAGSLYRNGPGKFHRPGGSVKHWFDGDGLMRAFRISDGAATMEARFIDTPKRRADAAAGAVITPGFGTPAGPGAKIRNNDDVNAANISVMPVNGELWALWEAGSPIALDPSDLSTKGIKTLRPDLQHVPFLAHPRREAGGDTWSLGVNGKQALVWRLGPDGAVKSADMLDLPVASYIHDFTATKTKLILVLQPWVQDRMVMPYNDSFTWRPELGTKVLVVEKDDLSKRRIYELPSAFAFHYGSAWEETDGTIRFDGCFSPDSRFATENGKALMTGTWKPQGAAILNLVTLRPDGRASMESTGVAAEFPRTDGRVAGGPRRYTVHATAAAPNAPLFHGVASHDWKTGKSDAFDFGIHQLMEEAVFVARPGGSDELDGWLLAPSVNTKAKVTELHVFDARRIAAGPLGTWRADRALPVSLHGAFVRA